MRYNVVLRNYFITEATFFTHLKLNYVNKNTFMKNNKIFVTNGINYMSFKAVYSYTNIILIGLTICCLKQYTVIRLSYYISKCQNIVI